MTSVISRGRAPLVQEQGHQVATDATSLGPWLSPVKLRNKSAIYPRPLILVVEMIFPALSFSLPDFTVSSHLDSSKASAIQSLDCANHTIGFQHWLP